MNDEPDDLTRGRPSVPTDTVTDRGFTHADPIPGVAGYGGQVRVYESSGAAAPRLWLMTIDGEGNEATIHLELDDARRLLDDINRLADNHYQLRG